MTDERRRKAAERALRRRAGASRQHSEKVKQHMLAQEDLYTTCPRCGSRISGTMEAIQQHVELCDGH